MPKEKTLIPNKQIELMFFRIASDAEVQKYVELAEGGLRHTASAYASNKVYHLFMDLVDLAEAIGALPVPSADLPETDPPGQPVQPPLIIGGYAPDHAVAMGEGYRSRMRQELRVLPGGSPRVKTR